MAKVWEYRGYTIDEGLKPRDENFKADYYQYFFIVKKGDERVMKYCVWAPRGDVETSEEVRVKGLERVKERIDAGNFQNLLLEITVDGAKELPLDELPEKLT